MIVLLKWERLNLTYTERVNWFHFLDAKWKPNEKPELGVGVGPLKDLISTLVEQFVLSRLSTLFNDGTVQPSLYHFTREECNIEMYLAGQVSGIFYFDSNANPPAFKYLH
jgi:hypothetical protein